MARRRLENNNTRPNTPKHDKKLLRPPLPLYKHIYRLRRLAVHPHVYTHWRLHMWVRACAWTPYPCMIREGEYRRAWLRVRLR